MRSCRGRTRLALAATLAGLTAACSPLGLFARFTPKDPAVRAATGVAYGADPRQKLDIYQPVGAAAGMPVAIFFYGGGWNSGRRQDYGWVGRALAAKGFLTVVPDYRLYPQVRYPDFLRDGAQAVRWTTDHARGYGGDPARIALVGHSAGAYNAVMLGLAPGYLEAAGVDPAVVKAVAGLSGPYDFLPLDEASRPSFGGAGDLAATQPVNHVTADAPAAFLATGDEDTVVLPRNTHRLAARLRATGVPVEEKTYAGLDHAGMALALSRPFRGKAPVLAEMSAFLHAHLR